MKKRISLILAVVMTLSLVSASCISIAAELIELPMIPLNPSDPPSNPPVVTPTVNTEVRLTSDADETVGGGAIVNFTTEINKLPTNGISSVELVYTYSDSLELNGNITASSLPEGF